MTRPVSDTPIGDAIIPAPVVDTVTVVQPAAVGTDLLGQWVILADGHEGIATEVTDDMVLLTNANEAGAVESAWQWREHIATVHNPPPAS